MASLVGTVNIGGGFTTFDIVNANTAGVTSIVNNGVTTFFNATSAGSAAITNNFILHFNDTSTAGAATIANDGGHLFFLDSSTAGSSKITNNAALEFRDASSAGNASFTNNIQLIFRNTTTAANATITNTTASELQFADTSTAASATIVNNDGSVEFRDNSTAANAKITNNNGQVFFVGSSTAGNATVIISNSGQVLFQGSATAGSASVSGSGLVSFSDMSTAGNATFVRTLDSRIDFSDTTTAANAIITLNDEASASFFGDASAGNARITINRDTGAPDGSSPRLAFGDQATAANATINNANALVQFYNNSTAGNATITNNGNALVQFFDTSTAGNARLINNQNGIFDFSGTSGPNDNRRISAGSIEGSGSFYLGANQLTVGGNNLSTIISGVISDCGPTGAECYAVTSADPTDPTIPVIPSTGGSLIKIGSGTLTLAGDNTYTGATTVNAGTLLVTGSISNSAVTVNNGGTLGGTGTVGSTTINGGTLAPGMSIGTITIKGSLVLTAAATYMIEVSPTAADRTNVSGAASLAGTMQLAVQGGTYTAGKTYTLLHTDGGRSGTFTTGDISDPFGPAIRAEIDYTANDVILNLVLNSVTPFLPAGAPTNVRNVGGAIDKVLQSGNFPPQFLSLFGFTPAGLVNALNQASGQPATGAQQASHMATGMFLSSMLDPFADGRGESFGPAMGYAPGQALGFAPEARALPAAARAFDRMVTKAPSSGVLDSDPRWTVWGKAFGGRNRTGGDPIVGSNDVAASIGGFAGGTDFRPTPDTLVGAAVAAGETHWSVARLGSGRSDVAQVGAYASTRWNGMYLSAAAAGAWHNASTDRVVTIAGTDRLVGNFDAHSFGVRVEAGRRFEMPVNLASFGLTPYAAVQMLSVRTPAYAENAVVGSNAFALVYSAQTATDTRSELGAWADTRRVLDSGMLLTLRGRAAWVHDFNPDRAINAAFQALPVAALYGQWGGGGARRRAHVGGGGGEAAQRHCALRQVRRRVCPALGDLFRNGHGAVRLVRRSAPGTVQWRPH